MTSFKSKLIILAISIIAVMIPAAVFADKADNEHQHSRQLIRVVTTDTGLGIAHHARFFCNKCYALYDDSLTTEDSSSGLSSSPIICDSDIKKTSLYFAKDCSFPSWKNDIKKHESQ